MKTSLQLSGLVSALAAPASAAIVRTGAPSADPFDDANRDFFGSRMTVIPAVPEPSGVFFAGLGGLPMGFRRQK
ncbi:MAG: hypothetical protein ACON5H_04300 [Akkermansiaceae bacterium]